MKQTIRVHKLLINFFRKTYFVFMLSDDLRKIAKKLRQEVEFTHLQATRDRSFAYYLKWLLHSSNIYGISEDLPPGDHKRYLIDRVIRVLLQKESRHNISIRKILGPIEKEHPRYPKRKFIFRLFYVKLKGFKEFRIALITGGWYRPGFKIRSLYISNNSREVARKFFQKVG